MIDKDIEFESTERALTNFENIKECMQGLYEILRITLNPENPYFKIGQDNIEALYQNFLELMVNEVGAKQFIQKLKRSEVDLDILLENL